ncbi:GNAT family N-acetyltransferase [Solibacillus sp. CAU 1738]|uniref:GNAT family N-acetyltransferase n=1 Tax=Solibacillus sp. CAU 1738 TaxID=3140363 RepID=UPI00325FE0C9
MDIQTRMLRNSDYDKITDLLAELGYPMTLEDVTMQYEELQKHPDYETIVAVKNDSIVGIAGLCKSYYFERKGTYARILTFVVSEAERQQGIGTKLLQTCEQWAIEQGCNSIALNSGNRKERQAAHAFYIANGYVGRSTGFSKSIGDM